MDSSIGPTGSPPPGSGPQDPLASPPPSGSSFTVNPNDPWLFGLGGVLSPGQAITFKLKMMAYFCKNVADQISQEQQKAEKAIKDMQKTAEGEDTDL